MRSLVGTNITIHSFFIGSAFGHVPTVQLTLNPSISIHHIGIHPQKTG